MLKCCVMKFAESSITSWSSLLARLPGDQTTTSASLRLSVSRVVLEDVEQLELRAVFAAELHSVVLREDGAAVAHAPAAGHVLFHQYLRELAPSIMAEDIRERLEHRVWATGVDAVRPLLILAKVLRDEAFRPG